MPTSLPFVVLTSLPLTSCEVDVIILHFFGGAHTEGESFDEEFRDEAEQKVHDLKENKSNDGDEFLNRPITYEEVEASIQRLKKDKAVKSTRTGHHIHGHVTC